MSTVMLQQTLLLVSALILIAGSRAATRSGRLSFGTSVLWGSIGVLSIVAAFLIPSVERIGLVLGLLPAAILAGSASLVLAVIAFTLSLRVSSLEDALQDTIEGLALANAHPDLTHADRADHPFDGTVVVVPAFNEAPSVSEVVDSLRALGLPVIVVDDGSTDATAQVARAAGATVMELPSNLGVGGALRAGIRLALRAGYRQVVQCDADGQHPAHEVNALLLEQHKNPRDLLIGSRFTTRGSRKGEGIVRWSAMSLLALVASRSAGTRITDATSGLRVIRRPLLDQLAEKIPRHYLGDTFEVIVAAGSAGFRIAETPVTMSDRIYGSSSASPAAAFGLTLRALLIGVLRAHRRLDRDRSSS
jgi:hypothetical protein